MHEMPVSNRPIVREVLAHRRDDDAVRQDEIAQTEGSEHRWRDELATTGDTEDRRFNPSRTGLFLRVPRVLRGGELHDLALRFAGDELVHAREELRIARAQILVRDPQRARQQRERELNRLERRAPLGILEPLQRRLLYALQALQRL